MRLLGARRGLCRGAESAYRAFVQCAPGLEQTLAGELAELNVGRRARIEAGGVSVWVDQTGLWTVATQALVADAIRVRVGGAFRATSFEQLTAGFRQSVAPALRAFVRDPQGMPLRVRCKQSRLWHSGAVEQRVAEALQLGAGPSSAASAPAPEPLTLSVRLLRDEVEASVEAASGLHLRGCKPHSTDNQLNETVAAACARAALGACGSSAPDVWDPFCGSGTFLLEAALLLRRRESGSALVAARLETAARLPLARFAAHDADGYAAFLREAVSRASALEPGTPPPAHLFGSDSSQRAVRACRHNVTHGLGALALGGRVTTLEPSDFEAAAQLVPERATVLTNIPWQVRSQPESEARLYARLGGVLRARARSGARAFVLSGNEHFVRLSGCTWRTVLRLRVGGAPVHLVELDS